jgi:DNA modification methylase
VAAVELGRRFVGFELDPGYAGAARARLEAATAG